MRMSGTDEIEVGTEDEVVEATLELLEKKTRSARSETCEGKEASCRA